MEVDDIDLDRRRTYYTLSDFVDQVKDSLDYVFDLEPIDL